MNEKTVVDAITSAAMEAEAGFDLGLRPEELAIVELSDRLSREHIAPRASQYDREGTFPVDDYEELFEHGLTTMYVPAAYGGLGLRPQAYAQVVKNLARGNASTALTLNMHSALCRIIDLVGSEEQKARYFAKAVEQRALFASLGSEPAASFNREKVINSVPIRDGNTFRLTTAKHFCSLSSVASDLFVWVNLPDASFDDGYFCLAIASDSPGVEVQRTWDTMALRSTESHSVRFDDVAVPAANQIGAPGDFTRHGLHSAFVLGYSAVYLGVAEAAYELAHDYAATKVFPADPRPICHEPKVQARVATMSVWIQAANLLMRRAAATFEHGSKEERTLSLDQSKYFVGETALMVSDSALQIVGGRGIMRSASLERHIRDARASAVMPPSGDRCLEVLGQLLFDIKDE